MDLALIQPQKIPGINLKLLTLSCHLLQKKYTQVAWQKKLIILLKNIFFNLTLIIIGSKFSVMGTRISLFNSAFSLFKKLMLICFCFCFFSENQMLFFNIN